MCPLCIQWTNVCVSTYIFTYFSFPTFKKLKRIDLITFSNLESDGLLKEVLTLRCGNLEGAQRGFYCEFYEKSL